MHIANIDTHLVRRLQPARKQLQQLLHHSTGFRTVSLLLVNLAGCALMLSAPLTLAFTTGSVLSMLGRIQGPLDWFLVEVLGSLAVFSGFLSYQLVGTRPAQPRGVPVGGSHAPVLHDMVARRAAHFKLRPIRTILLTTEAELHMVATPVLPLPFFHRHTLCAGAPLLLFLNRSQFRLALAGAVAAAATNRKQLGGWINQAASDWQLIVDALAARDTLLGRVFTRPLRLIAAACVALSRPQDTDWRQRQGRWLLENSNETNTADFLANQIVAAAFLRKQYWPMVLKAAERSPAPVVKAFSHLPLLLDKTLNRALAERWLMQAQTAGEQQQTGVRDLLAELRIDQLSWSGLPQPNVFDELFTSSHILKQLDTFWQRDVEPEWRRRHALFQNDQLRFRQLQKRAAESGLRGESALRYIKLAPHFLELADTLSVYRDVFNNNRDDARVCFAAGLAQLRAGAIAEGSSALQRAGELDPALARRARSLISEHRQARLSEEIGGGAVPSQGICA